MNLKDYIDKAETIDIEELKNKTLSDLIAKFHVKNILRMYIYKTNLTMHSQLRKDQLSAVSSNTLVIQSINSLY